MYLEFKKSQDLRNSIHKNLLYNLKIFDFKGFKYCDVNVRYVFKS